jgi:hypothetical protein
MYTGNPNSFEDQQSFAPHLLASERILWTGRPPGGILFRKSDGLLIPFSLLWGGFALFWEYSAYHSGAPWFFLLFGGFFVIIGLFIIFGRFIYDKMVRENTVYAVTNERILILAGLFNQSLQALSLKNQSEFSLELSDNGRGTITFGAAGGFVSGLYNPGWQGSGKRVLPMLEKIENASDVYKLIQSTARQ